jgi:hypothetical protein
LINSITLKKILKIITNLLLCIGIFFYDEDEKQKIEEAKVHDRLKQQIIPQQHSTSVSW